MQRLALLAAAASLLHVAACGADLEPEAELCARVLHRRLPAARVTGAEVSEPARVAAIDYDVKTGFWTEPSRGSLQCAFEPIERGTLRLREASLNGAPLSSAEVAVVNADLLFDDMRDAGANASSD
jgi:hypothetical protein